MVHPDSHKVSRAPWYSGTEREEHRLSPTGLSPSVAALSSDLRLDGFLVTSWLAPYSAPQPPENPEALEFGLFRFRSPLLTESQFAFFSSGY